MIKTQDFVPSVYHTAPYIYDENQMYHPDIETYHIEVFFTKFGRYPDLNNPKTFNEKVLYRKLYDRRQILVDMQDKYASRGIADSKCPGVNLIPLRHSGVRYRPGRNSFPFIAKTNNGVRKTFYVQTPAEWMLVGQALRVMRGDGFQYRSGEWAYGQIPYRVMIEEPLSVVGEAKFFCFGGSAKLGRLLIPRGLTDVRVKSPEKEPFVYIDRDGSVLDLRDDKQRSVLKGVPDMPIQEMVRIVERLSAGIDFARVDLLYANGEVFFDEYTMYPGSGLRKFIPESFDEQLGSYWDLHECRPEPQDSIEDAPVYSIIQGDRE